MEGRKCYCCFVGTGDEVEVVLKGAPPARCYFIPYIMILYKYLVNFGIVLVSHLLQRSSGSLHTWEPWCTGTCEGSYSMHCQVKIPVSVVR